MKIIKHLSPEGKLFLRNVFNLKSTVGNFMFYVLYCRGLEKRRPRRSEVLAPFGNRKAHPSWAKRAGLEGLTGSSLLYGKVGDVFRSITNLHVKVCCKY